MGKGTRGKLLNLCFMNEILGDVDKEIVFKDEVWICNLQPVNLGRSGILFHGISPLSSVD